MEAPNEIKFQSPITSFGQGGILTNSGPIFESIFNLESQKFQSRSTEYQPPSPKNGVTWLELNNQTPFKDIQQKMAQLKQPGLLKFSDLKANSMGLAPILSMAQKNKNIQHLIIRHSNLHQHQINLIQRVLSLNDGIAWLVLDHNEIDDSKLKALLQDLHPDNNITHLVLSNNQLSDNGANMILQKRPILAKLETLWLDNNHLTDKSIPVIKQLLLKTEGVKTISLKGNNFSPQGKIDLIRLSEQKQIRCYC